MPLYGQQAGGSWMPQFGAGNWSSQWGQRPGNFQPGQNAYSYFQQNQGQIPNYFGGGLRNALSSWFPAFSDGNQGGGPKVDPRYPQTPTQPQLPPGAGAIGTVPPNGDYLGPPADVPNIYNPNPGYGTPSVPGIPKPGMLGNPYTIGNVGLPRDNVTMPQPYDWTTNITPGTPKYPNQPDPYTPPTPRPEGGGVKNFRNGGWF